MRSVVLTAFFAAGIVACGGPQKYTMQGTGNAVGADAKLVADIREETGSTALDLKVEHLAPPDRVESGATAYVVWQRSGPSVPWSRVGVLEYNADERKGTLKNVSVPLTAFDLQVTAEADAATVSPTSTVVFSQRVQKK